MRRNLLGIGWGIILFICTCTVDFQELIDHLSIRFVLDRNPDWNGLFMINDMDLQDPTYVIQKIGHFFGFFVLSLIVTNRGQWKNGIYVSMGYAALTELLQLFFHRDGRIVDIFIDSAGILLAVAICYYANSWREAS
ncbi:VanZ family protein [Paenibacillus mendelii]|uniref:VanZ family protein n=1 Tax=Paenibacillus mendelii TaxID=206163 RepID=A0ABV6JJ22_9BACL|nr:VanZ family protein [Paenibacillus mendelii]MCQ6558844.1 VanZ family protein [Paenibacillus mendelii]